MNHLTREILTTTRALSADDRRDLWRARMKARAEQRRNGFRAQPATPPGHLSALGWLRSFLLRVKSS